jgi:pyruvate/2-oxoglutarate dehydrogenase complex dihydrolipoamide dehydrogenase (E3) component
VKLPVRQMVPSLCTAGDLLLVAGGTHTETSSSGVRLAGTGKQTKPEVVWQTKRFSPEVASPVVVDGRMFAVNDTGMLACLDAATGEILEKTRLEQGRYWSSLVAADGKIYAISDEGIVTVVAATPELAELGRSELGEFCAATPAIASNRLLIRTEKHLWCFGSAQGSEKE